ncbi:class I lanthipeptide [uncultured Aquimarina sp.]|uniref:class I lanthipeptide n=1 Tax=uncultured Aquimarina sp. TaxID=575652 RepID=UPI0026102981|nr:class I lanthipeptide [uncultured Aquimarina sp.]
MKKKGVKKLSLDKIKIAQLNNPQAIIGGSIIPTQENIPSITCTKYTEDRKTSNSTKTLPASDSANCM